MKKIKVIDVSVLKFQFYHASIKSFDENFHRRDSTVKYFVEQFRGVIDCFDGSAVLVYDEKGPLSNGELGYWRGEFILQRQEYYAEMLGSKKGYKGHRQKEYTVLLDYIAEAMYQLREYYPWLSYPLLEADDHAALLCKYKPDNVAIDLVTVDRDWAMLTNDEKNIRWVNLHKKNWGRIEEEAEVMEYYRAKLSPDLTNIRDVAQAKVEMGDVGDNLPKGCDIEVICLHNYCAPLEVEAAFGPELRLEFPEFRVAHDAVVRFYAEFLGLSNMAGT